MTALRDVEADLSRFRTRGWVAVLGVLVAFGLVAARAVFLQVVRHDDLRAQAESNRTAVLPIVPHRGLILDRNGLALATNYSAYTLEITPSRVVNVEAVIDELATLIDIQMRDRRRFKRLREESRNFDSLPIRTRLTDEEVARTATDSRALKSRHACFASTPTGIPPATWWVTSAASTWPKKTR
jgi:penicillin-binding protein 2